MIPEDKTSIVGNCIILSIELMLLIAALVCYFILRADSASPQFLRSLYLSAVLFTAGAVHQVFILRKKLALRKEKEEGGNDEYDSGR